ncbi:MAG: hypothetical protein AAGA58_13865, partial [Verrucomicrobiota bacterium]
MLPRFFLTCFLVLGISTLGVRGFYPPDFSKQLFSMDGTLVTEEEEKELVGLLVSILETSKADKEIGLAEKKAVALAMQIDPVSRKARETLAKLKDGDLPGEVGEDAVKRIDIAKGILEKALALDQPAASPDELALAAYLIDVALEVEPSLKAARLPELAEVVQRAGISGWNGVIKGSGDADALMAQAQGSSVPRDEAQPVAETGRAEEDPEEALAQLGFVIAKSRFNALSVRSKEARGERQVETSVATLMARVEMSPADEQTPELRSDDFSSNNAARGLDAKRLMQVIRDVEPEWPLRGDVVVDVIDGNLKQPTRPSELPLALAALSLRSGNSLASNVLAIGAVTDDGNLMPLQLFAEMLTSSSERLAPYYLIVPGSAESDLVDFALAGRLDLLLKHQVFLASSVTEAARLATAKPPETFQRALLEFGQIQDAFDDENSVELEALQEEATVDRLRNIVSISPNHATAAVLLRALEEKLPARFSQSGTMRMLFEHLQAWKAVPDSISR